MFYKNKVIVDSSEISDPKGMVVEGDQIYVVDNSLGLMLHFNTKGDPQIPISVTVPQAPGAPHPTPYGLSLNPSRGFVIGKSYDEPECKFFINKSEIANILGAPNPCTTQKTTTQIVKGLTPEQFVCKPKVKTGVCIGCENLTSTVIKTASSQLVTCTGDGIVAGYSILVDPDNFITKFISEDGASYTGCTMYQDLLYLADNRNGKIDVLDSNWYLQSQDDYPFEDPLKPLGFVPYNVKVIGAEIFVTYGYRNPLDDYTVPLDPNLGFVSSFTSDGYFLRRVATFDDLLPYGLAVQMYVSEDKKLAKLECKRGCESQSVVDHVKHRDPCAKQNFVEVLLVGNNTLGNIARYLFNSSKKLDDLEAKPIPGLFTLLNDPCNQEFYYYTAPGKVGKLVYDPCCSVTSDFCN